MKALVNLSIKSFGNRKGSVLLAILSIALSALLLLGIESLRDQSKNWFQQTVSGVDLVVGARTSPLHLMLYSIFHIGNPANNLSWKSFEILADHQWVDWVIPISLGDSHKGFAVVGTTNEFFQHFQVSGKRHLAFAQGTSFQSAQQVVIGAEVAAALNYTMQSNVVIAHGTGEISFLEHYDTPFQVVGILQRTGTPSDRNLFIALSDMDKLHAQEHSQHPKTEDEAHHGNISAAFLSLKDRSALFQMQHMINTYEGEALSAVIPGLALTELWSLLGSFEQVLLLVSVFVIIAGLIGLMITLIATLNERRREMAILRAVGARPKTIFFLYVLEAFWIGLFAILLAIVLLYSALFLAGPFIESHWGFPLQILPLSYFQWQLLAAILGFATFVGIVPGILAYRHALADGLSMRV